MTIFFTKSYEIASEIFPENLIWESLFENFQELQSILGQVQRPDFKSVKVQSVMGLVIGGRCDPDRQIGQSTPRPTAARLSLALSATNNCRQHSQFWLKWCGIATNCEMYITALTQLLYIFYNIHLHCCLSICWFFFLFWQIQIRIWW